MSPVRHAQKLRNGVLYLFGAAVLIFSVVFAYLMLWPVDVIKNSTWELTVPKKAYKAGDTVDVHVVADKLKPLSGRFIRTVECKNLSGSYVSYHIADSASNRASGHVVTDVPVKLPDTVPDLPATCRIGFVVEYQVYSFRSFSEYNFTNEFRLLPGPDPATAPALPTPTHNLSSLFSSPAPQIQATKTKTAPVPAGSSQSKSQNQPTNNQHNTDTPGRGTSVIENITSFLEKLL